MDKELFVKIITEIRRGVQCESAVDLLCEIFRNNNIQLYIQSDMSASDIYDFLIEKGGVTA